MVIFYELLWVVAALFPGMYTVDIDIMISQIMS